MTQNPITKVLSVLHGCRVRFLLMGGQACVLYGGSEFSRDTDIALLPDRENIKNLELALEELKAENIAIPKLSLGFLKKGHAIHFRCKHPDALNMRIDIMSVMRNSPPFETLWNRRSTIGLGNDLLVDVISLPDLVAIKKTQRDKDWTHVKRLVEAHYLENREKASNSDIRFWLLESRTPEILQALSSRYPELISELKTQRPLLCLLPNATESAIIEALSNEEEQERKADKQYWQPLLKELEKERHNR